jgi:hypothetical protein
LKGAGSQVRFLVAYEKVPEGQLMDTQSYRLAIDGPLLRRQRLLLVAREADLCDTERLSANSGELAAIRGLIELTDAIAD